MNNQQTAVKLYDFANTYDISLTLTNAKSTEGLPFSTTPVAPWRVTIYNQAELSITKKVCLLALALGQVCVAKGLGQTDPVFESAKLKLSLEDALLFSEKKLVLENLRNSADQGKNFLQAVGYDHMQDYGNTCDEVVQYYIDRFNLLGKNMLQLAMATAREKRNAQSNLS